MRTALLILVLGALSLPLATAQKMAQSTTVSGGGRNDPWVGHAHSSRAHTHHARHHSMHWNHR